MSTKRSRKEYNTPPHVLTLAHFVRIHFNDFEVCLVSPEVSKLFSRFWFFFVMCWSSGSTSDCGCLTVWCIIILFLLFYVSGIIWVCYFMYSFFFCLSVIGFCLFLWYFLIGMVFLIADGCEVRGWWRRPTAYVCSPSRSLLLRSPVDIFLLGSELLVPLFLYSSVSLWEVIFTMFMLVGWINIVKFCPVFLKN